MNAKRWQTAAAIVLGLIAAALLARVVILYAALGQAAPVAMAPAALPAASGYALIDLNRADEAELSALPGIGEVLAGRIVEYREENGPFRSKDDVLAVYGIGEATYQKLEPYITY